MPIETAEELLVSIAESSYRWGDRVNRIKQWGKAQYEAGQAEAYITSQREIKLLTTRMDELEARIND